MRHLVTSAVVGLASVLALAACSSDPAPYVYLDSGVQYECPLPPQSWVTSCPGYVVPHSYVAPYTPHRYGGSRTPKVYQSSKPAPSSASGQAPKPQAPKVKAPPPPVPQVKAPAPKPPAPKPPAPRPAAPRPAPRSGR